ncbi:hypothetical protein [Geitlerinema sp. PCC 7407]|uniref:hypothetical protein n=1 Tax=Geitlerinema sp. PCC 7407 TaxID=1173025 RepID=UPI00029FECC8|nr:hypothetical protein [Geitlerinema sp. PCC 7407]AFY64736.1 hypothetical protein GEI7407_0231 [Geitlerinema sp. PCC 7407]
MMIPHERFQNFPDHGGEAFSVTQTTLEFYQEVQYREAHGRYCSWYAAIAHAHQQELIKMRGEPNLLGWFTQRRSPR